MFWIMYGSFQALHKALGVLEGKIKEHISRTKFKNFTFSQKSRLQPRINFDIFPTKPPRMVIFHEYGCKMRFKKTFGGTSNRKGESFKLQSRSNHSQISSCRPILTLFSPRNHRGRLSTAAVSLISNAFLSRGRK